MSSLISKPTKFQETFRKLCSLLKEYTPGDALPTVRRLAEYMDVSIFTLHGALEELRKNDLIYQEAGHRGYYLKKHPEEGIFSDIKEAHGKKTINYCICSRHNLRKMRYLLAYRDFRNLYEKSHPGIEMNEISITASGRREMEEQQLLALLEDNSTGIGSSSCFLDSYREMNLLRTLDFPELPSDNRTFPDDIDHLICRDGHRYMYPLSHSISYVIYNKEHFKACSLNPEKVFVSPETFMSGLWTLKKKYSGHIPFVVYEELDFIQLLQFQLVLGQGGNVPHEQALSPEWGNASMLAEKCSWLFNLLNEKQLMDLLPYNFTPAAALDLLNERTSMTIGNGQIAAILLAKDKADRFGIAPLPGGMENIRTLGNVSGIFVSSQADDETARIYLDFEISFHRYYSELSARRGCGSLASPYQDVSRADLPEDWKRSFAFINDGILWEPRDSNHNKNLLIDAVSFIRREPFQEDSAVTCRMLADFFNFES